MIAFSSERGGPVRVHVIGSASGSHRILQSRGLGMDVEPDWSPDGSKIVFTSRRGGFPHIWVMNADGSGERKLVKALSSAPSWSPDGATIAYTVETSSGSEIATVQRNGRGVTRLTDKAGATNTSPSWSPDGTRIAFASERDGDADIFEMSADGTGVHALTTGVWTDGAPAWRP